MDAGLFSCMGWYDTKSPTILMCDTLKLLVYINLLHSLHILGLSCKLNDASATSAGVEGDP
jgi:hypothetical protein